MPTLRELEDAVNKGIGASLITHLNDEKSNKKIQGISTGSMTLNLALSGTPNIGFEYGRIVELVGPEGCSKTTLALHCVAEAQKIELPCLYIDVENALDPTYMKKLGIDLTKLSVLQPDYGEAALQAAINGVKEGYRLIIVDSVAALSPKAELDGDVGDSHMGLTARMMGQALRKISALVNKKKAIVIFINQIRMKIGVMFGCVHGETLVNFVDGRSFTIKYVVDNKIKGKVWSYNEHSCLFEAKSIIGWHNNGIVSSISDFIHIETESINSKGGTFGFSVTPDHLLMTDRGWVSSKDILLKDRLLTKYDSIFNGTLKDFLCGMFIGDCHINVQRNGNRTANLHIQDRQNAEYSQWKLDKLNKAFEFKSVSNRYDSNFTYELFKIKQELGNRDPLFMLENNYSDIGLALWIMDDGNLDTNISHCRYTLSVKRFKNNRLKLQAIERSLKHHLGLDCLININYNDGSIQFNKDSSIKIASIICEYVPECMQYKLPIEFRNKYIDFNLKFKSRVLSDYVSIKLIRFIGNRQFRTKGKYDLTIYGNNNFGVGGITNGVIIHNSPETSPGGMALRYAASYRIDLRAPRGGKVEDKDMAEGNKEVGVDVNLKVIKNKTFPPYRHASYRIMFGKGIDRYLDLVNYLDKKGLLDDGKLVYNRHRLSKKQVYLDLKTDKNLRMFVINLIKEDAYPSKKEAK